MKELETRATEAASTFLRRRGYAVLETGWESEAGTADIVAEDGDALVFVRVRVRWGAGSAFPAEGGASERDECERVALAYLAEYGKVDVPVRFDDIAMVAISSDRAMIRHHINSLGGDIEFSEDALPEVA